MSALGETSFPVPKTYLFCEDKTIMGQEFYVMEYIKVFSHGTMIIFYLVNGGRNVYLHSVQKPMRALIKSVTPIYVHDYSNVSIIAYFMMQTRKSFSYLPLLPSTDNAIPKRTPQGA